MGGKTPWAD